MTLLERPGFRSGLLAFALFTILAGDVWRYSITWYGFAVVVVGVSVFSVVLLVRNRALWRLATLPYPLLAFVGLTTVSIAWSAYPSSSAVGIVATLLTVVSAVAFAVSYSWQEIIRALGLALRIILSLSLLFELFVALVVRRPILPFWSPYVDDGTLAKSLYWSRDLLLDGGKIQGIVGNSALLGFVALLSLIVFSVQLAAGTGRRWRGIAWVAFAAVMIYLTRSATITLALVAVVAVALAVLLVRSAPTARRRFGYYWLIAATVAALVVTALTLRDTLLSAMGKQPDLTGRTDIWDAVIGLASQRPFFGWGWVSYWTPWGEPLNKLAFEGGVQQYQAHNAWLDVWLQVGIVGLVVFGALVVSTTIRAWFFAADRSITRPGTVGSYSVESMLPLLLLTALLVQSLAESRLIIEYGLLLLVIIAIKTKRNDPIVPMDAR
jgi:exopolysaccharide production protein ExoQ